MNKDNEKRVPELRFKGFDGDWEQRKLGELFSITDTKHATAPVTESKTRFRMIRTSYVKGGQLLTNQTDSVSEETYNIWSERIRLKPNDIVFSREAPIGEVAIIPDDTVHYFLGQRMVALRAISTSMVDVYFALATLLAPGFRKEVKIRNSASTTVANFGIPDIKKTKIATPSHTEQQSVGLLLLRLNETVTLHECKLELLKELKKAYLQKLFPENGNKIPQLRFVGFADDWEQRKLSEVTQSHNSGVYISKDLYGDGINIIGVGDIYDSDVIDGRQYRLAPVTDPQFILHNGDLLYGESSLVPEGIARVVSVDENGAGTAFAWHTRRFQVNNAQCNSHFLGLELDYWLPARSHLKRSATKTALTGITTRDFFNTQIVFPTLPEQLHIASLISLIDRTIALHQRKLEKLQQLKQVYLQKLFT